MGLTPGVLAVIKRERAGRDQRTLKPPDRGRATADAYRKYLIALASAFSQPLSHPSLMSFRIPFPYPLPFAFLFSIVNPHRIGLYLTPSQEGQSIAKTSFLEWNNYENRCHEDCSSDGVFPRKDTLEENQIRLCLFWQRFGFCLVLWEPPKVTPLF